MSSVKSFATLSGAERFMIILFSNLNVIAAEKEPGGFPMPEQNSPQRKMKTIALIDDHPELKGLTSEIHDNMENLKKQLEFIQTRANQQIDSASSIAKEFASTRFDKMIDILKEKGKLTDFDPDKQFLGFDLNMNTILVIEKEQPSIQ